MSGSGREVGLEGGKGKEASLVGGSGREVGLEGGKGNILSGWEWEGSGVRGR